MNNSFTLIELLVVITIIGILASVVLVSFPGAVGKAKDGRVISSMSQLRTQSTILFTNKDSYSDLDCTIINKVCDCPDDAIETLCNDIEENSDQDVVIRINNNEQAFCVVAHLQGSGNYFCVDEQLHAKEYETNPLLTGEPCTLECEANDNCACE